MHIEHARPEDAGDIVQLLERNALPTDGVEDRIATTLVARTAGVIAGTASLELYDTPAYRANAGVGPYSGSLLRSVAVDASYRGSGIGRELVLAALRLARSAGVPAVYLLTTTAEEYFPRFGFERIAREDVVPAVRASYEFTSACPSSATVMRLTLDPEFARVETNS